MESHNGSRRELLAQKYPPSEPCSCNICRSYCKRPGWWSVNEAKMAVLAGYGDRMMLEISPEGKIGVLSPAFRGCEGRIALRIYAAFGCTFFKNHRCELHETGLLPLECKFCHHERPGEGILCHEALEHDWERADGQNLVKYWVERFLKEDGIKKQKA